MSTTAITEIRRGFYLDSVALMRLSREIASMEGVVGAALMMGSPSNLAVMRDAGLLGEDCDARPNDLVLALRASDAASAEAARQAAFAGLDAPRASGAAEARAWRPRSLAAAVEALPEANLALISVPGEFAASEAHKALRRGLNVMLFSDNVTLADERALKEDARGRGLLMMGPDCGTAIIAGTPLAFANRVRAGGVGVIGASGTGIQEVTSLISEGGGGISHAIGTGGRDLGVEIGGITTLMAMDLLDADPETESVVLISKPPHPEVARAVAARIAQSAKPHVLCFIGADDLALPANARQAPDLCAAAEYALGRPVGEGFDIGAEAAAAPGRRRDGRIEGLYSGGTLAAEAQVILRAAGRQVVSNAPVPGAGRPGPGDAGADRVLDLGGDEYTRGRPHPMIDPALREQMLAPVLADPQVSVVLLDLVLGVGAHPDPAAGIAAVLAAAGPRRPPVVVSVTGTAGDPQGRARQVAALQAAGAVVAPSNAHAARLAGALAGGVGRGAGG